MSRGVAFSVDTRPPKVTQLKVTDEFVKSMAYLRQSSTTVDVNSTTSVDLVYPDGKRVDRECGDSTGVPIFLYPSGLIRIQWNILENCEPLPSTFTACPFHVNVSIAFDSSNKYFSPIDPSKMLVELSVAGKTYRAFDFNYSARQDNANVECSFRFLPVTLSRWTLVMSGLAIGDAGVMNSFSSHITAVVRGVRTMVRYEPVLR